MALPAIVGAGYLLGAASFAVAEAGTDWSGLALFVGAISSLIATVGGLVIALRKKPTDPAVALAIKLLQEHEAAQDETGP